MDPVIPRPLGLVQYRILVMPLGVIWWDFRGEAAANQEGLVGELESVGMWGLN